MVSTWSIQWHNDTNKHFGIVQLDVENALFSWLEKEFSPTGSVKALSRAGKLSQAWKSFSLSPVCLRDNECQPTRFIAEFCCEILQNINV